MTGFSHKNMSMFYRNLTKVKNFAEKAEVTSVSITGKGEPLQNNGSINTVLTILSKFRDSFPIEIQTNGDNLTKEVVDRLYDEGIDTIAISIDSQEQMNSLISIVEYIRIKGLTVRFTINLVPDIYNRNPKDFFIFANELGVHQLSFRNITIPSNPIDTETSRKTQEWIRENIDEEKVEEFLIAYQSYVQFWGEKVMDLPYGAVIYMINGVSTTYFDYCVQDESNGDDIRSLIYYEDGHLATTWYGSNYGRIF
jgi:sulfatase maturation enzyme AslB (radical SAM superfamily)